MAYLYGLSIKGIQGFIFETNKLKEIVGASDLIEYFSSKDFIENFLKQECNSEKYELLRNAAGNIRISFTNKDDVEKVVKNFTKSVMKQAYGITVSQAVVEYDKNYSDSMRELEQKLKVARSKTSLILDAKFALMDQAPRTGKPAAHIKLDPDGEERIFDRGSHQKFKRAKKGRENLLLKKMGIVKEHHDKFPVDMDKMSNGKNKIAVIHADGNGLGKLLQDMAEEHDGKGEEQVKKIFSDFSKNLEEATLSAIKESFHEYYSINDTTIKFRPIIIGGDDVAIICDADKAFEFTQMYLERFEHYTNEKLGSPLTACAGIAYCHKKRPFYFAIGLAEELCAYAKKASGRTSSCLMFHNIQSSYFDTYEEYVENELTVKLNNGKTASLVYGPYYSDKKPTMQTLRDIYDIMRHGDFPLGKLREWLTELHGTTEYSDEFLKRGRVVAESGKFDVAKLERKLKELGDLKLDSLLEEVDGGNFRTPVNDILQLKSVEGER